MYSLSSRSTEALSAHSARVRRDPVGILKTAATTSVAFIINVLFFFNDKRNFKMNNPFCGLQLGMKS